MSLTPRSDYQDSLPEPAKPSLAEKLAEYAKFIAAIIGGAPVQPSSSS